MSKDERKLLKKAKDIHKIILPCGKKDSFTECFTQHGDKLFFWFDTEDHSTHMLVAEIQ